MGRRVNFHIQQVVVMETKIGNGKEDDPVRDALAYYDMDGNLLFVTPADKHYETHYTPCPFSYPPDW